MWAKELSQSTSRMDTDLSGRLKSQIVDDKEEKADILEVERKALTKLVDKDILPFVLEFLGRHADLPLRLTSKVLEVSIASLVGAPISFPSNFLLSRG
jgi:hypothetical protein